MSGMSIGGLDVHRNYPTFISDVGKELRLRPEEQRIVGHANPFTWVGWSLGALSGDELIPYLPTDDPAIQPGAEAAPFFGGETTYEGIRVLDPQQGELARRVDALYVSKNPSASERLARLGKRAAEWTGLVGEAVGLESELWKSIMPRFPQALIEMNKVTNGPAVMFSDAKGFRFPVEGPLDTVMNFGPGLAGAAQFNGLRNQSKTVHFVSGGKGAHFVNAWIDMNARGAVLGIEAARRDPRLAARLAPGLNPHTVRFPEARYHTDGIAAAIGRLPTKTTVDLMILSAVHSAGTKECRAAVEGAASYLRPGGLFVVKAPNVSLGDEGGMDRISEQAVPLLGSPVAQGECGTLQQRIDPTQPLERPASFAIYQR